MKRPRRWNDRLCMREARENVSGGGRGGRWRIEKLDTVQSGLFDSLLATGCWIADLRLAGGEPSRSLIPGTHAFASGGLGVEIEWHRFSKRSRYASEDVFS